MKKEVKRLKRQFYYTNNKKEEYFMEETKENKKNKKGKHKSKPTIGDIVFRVLIIVAIFFICVMFYVFYIRNTISEAYYNNYTELTRQIEGRYY